MHLPIDLQIDLFKLVKPVLLKGCEACGFGNVEIIKHQAIEIPKICFKLKKCIPNQIVYGDVGTYHLKLIYTIE